MMTSCFCRFLRLLLSLALSAGASVAFAQHGPSPAVKLAAMEKLAFLEGSWSGGGWMSFGPDRRVEFTSTEEVRKRLGGVVLQVEGRHLAGDRVVHDALGLFSFDETKQQYRFRTYLANGLDGDFEANLVGDALQWSYDHPQAGRMRYTISLTADGKWHEIGESSRDGGQTWHQFFEMTLARK